MITTQWNWSVPWNKSVLARLMRSLGVQLVLILNDFLQAAASGWSPADAHAGTQLWVLEPHKPVRCTPQTRHYTLYWKFSKYAGVQSSIYFLNFQEQWQMSNLMYQDDVVPVFIIPKYVQFPRIYKAMYSFIIHSLSHAQSPNIFFCAYVLRTLLGP